MTRAPRRPHEPTPDITHATPQAASRLGAAAATETVGSASTSTSHAAIDRSPRVVAQQARVDALAASPALQRQQQRLARPAAPAGAAAVIQGYFSTREVRVARQDDEQAVFTTQSPKPTVARTPTGPQVSRQQTEHTGLQGEAKLPDGLLVADDHTMAIHDTEAEPKEFYATQRVVDNANQSLAGVESAFRLNADTGNAIDTGRHTLKMVKPLNHKQPDAAKDGDFVSLLSHICIQITAELTGTDGWSYEAVLGNEDDGRFTEALRPDGLHDDKVDRLAAHLARGGEADEDSVHGALNAKKKLPDNYARPYGKQQGKGQLDDKEQALGINRYAQPDVGEGYAIFSQRAKDKPQLDYAAKGTGRATRRDETWGYHFAGVVARSIAGDDRVTLENYNRGPEVKDAISPKLLAMAKFKKDLATFLKQNPQASVDEQVMHLISTNPEAYEVYTAGLQSAGDASALWFFRMYGTKLGQSFHEKQAADGGVVNPITVHVRRGLESQKTKKSGLVDSALRRYAHVLDQAAIPDPRAVPVIAGIRQALMQQGEAWKQDLAAAADNDALMAAIRKIQRELPPFAESQLVPPLRQLYLTVIGSEAGPDARATRATLLEQVRGSLAPTFMEVMFELVCSLYQGLPEAEEVRRDSLAGMAALLESLPDDPFA